MIVVELIRGTAQGFNRGSRLIESLNISTNAFDLMQK